MVRFSGKSAGSGVHRFDLVHQTSSQKQSHFNCHNIMSLVPLGPGKFKQNKLKHRMQNFWRQQISHEKKYKDMSMPSDYICNCKNPKKKKKKETLKHYLCQGFRTGLRRRERSMALFNRVNEFLNKVATLSKWKIMPDRGGKKSQSWNQNYSNDQECFRPEDKQRH